MATIEDEVKKSLFVAVIEEYVKLESLQAPVKRYLIGHEYNEEIRLSENRYLKASENEDYDYIHSHRLSNRNEVAEELAKKYDMSPATISKYGAFAKILEDVYIKNSAIAKDVLDEKTHLSHKDLKSLANSL